MLKGSCLAVFLLFALFVVIAATKIDTRTQIEKNDKGEYLTLTQEQFDALQLGMTTERVASILQTNGKETTLSTRDETATTTLRAYMGDDATQRVIVVEYANDRLTSKSQRSVI